MTKTELQIGIITPTIGRAHLKRCIQSLENQMFKKFWHMVVGDGPQELWVRQLCAEKQIRYLETPYKAGKGSYGAEPRNLALKIMPPCDYVVFLDDDNELLEPALYQINYAAVMARKPPLLYQDILFTNKYSEEYCIFPKTDKLVVEREWDLLNGVYRSDVIKDIRFKPSYKNDFLFTKDVLERIQNPSWVKVKGIGGIHHLSWDTYDG